MDRSTEQPDSAQSGSPSGSSLDQGFFPPVSGSETVVNPEGRPDYAPPGESLTPSTDPSVWQTLFPTATGEESEIPDPEGVQLDHFVIQHRIRSGGMGAVFRAHDTRMNRPVALKVMPPHQTMNPAAVRRFQNEAQSAAQLDHENIARAYYVGEDKGLHFIAFEFVTGVNIADMIHRQGRLAVEDALNYTLQVASAIMHTAERGVVHRDIKPSNIIITPKGRAKLVDMGLARNENRDESADLTVAGTTLGTFDYISPEQAKDPRTVDVRSDIYSLGCTLFHMLTGEAPYPGGTMLQKLLDHQGKDAPDPAKKSPYVSDDLSSVVRKMMASDPKRRYQTADELMRDLMLVAGSMGLRSQNPEGLVWMSARPLSAPFWERHLPWISTVLALIVLVVVASVYPQWAAKSHLQTDRSKESQRIASRSADATGAANGPVEKPDTGVEQKQGIQPTALDDAPEKDVSPAIREAQTRTQPPAKQQTVQQRNSATPREVVEPNSVGGDAEGPAGFVFSPEPTTPAARLGPESDRPTVTALLPPSSAYSSQDDVDSGAPGRRVAVKEADAGDELHGTTTSKQRRSPRTKVDAQETEKPGFVLLGIDGAPDKEYLSLEAACTDAIDGSKIELRFNGVRLENQHIRVENKRITVRAAEGYQPVLQLKPAKLPFGGHRTRFITVAGGALELANLHLTLSLDELTSAEEWAIFSLDQAQSVQLDGVTVSVANLDRRRDVSVIEVTAGTDFGGMEMPTNDAEKPLEIRLTGCVVRGGCNLLSMRQSTAAQVLIEDSLLALGSGGAVARLKASMYEPEPGTAVELTLNHVTALFSGGLITMSSATVPHKLIPVRVEATNNIFCGFSDCPLISMSGKATVQDFRSLLAWDGKYNHFDDFEAFWVIDVPTTAENTDLLRYFDWRQGPSIDEVDSANVRINWLDDWREVPAVELVPDDMVLDPDAHNQAASGTLTGRPAGAPRKDLPRPPKMRRGVLPRGSSNSGSSE